MRIIQFLSLLWSAIPLALKRLRHHIGLSLSSALGILSMLSLAVCVPIFANAVLRQSLIEQLAEKAAETGRSLFALHVVYPDNLEYTPLTLENARLISRHIEGWLERTMHLEQKDFVLQITSELMVWKPVKVQSVHPSFQEVHLYLMANNLAPGKMKLVEGAWPQGGLASEPLQVAVEESFADQRFLNVGDIYASRRMTVEVVGIFRVIDPHDPVWFFPPDLTFQDILWVPLDFFQERLPSLLERPLSATSWYAIVEDRSLRFQNSLAYTRQMMRLDASLRAMLPGARVDYTPLEQLRAYQARLGESMALFYAAGAPALALALLFIALIGSISARQYEQEAAMLCARGGSGGQMLVINLAESLVLVIAMLPASILLGWLAAFLMGQTELFLQFTRRPQFTFTLFDVHLGWLASAVLVVVGARLVPLLGRLRPSILTLKQERSRGMQKSFWERFYLDFLLLIPAGYAYLILRQRMRPAALTAGTQAAGGQYDPLMFVASSIFSLALCLLWLRGFPWVLRLLAWAGERFPQAWHYLAIQEIARRPREHSNAMLLVMISLSFSIFTASMASTLGRWVHDVEFYRVGADLAIKEYELPIYADAPQSKPFDVSQKVESLVSLQDHLKIPGILSATYVGKYVGKYASNSFWFDCQVMGIDRLTFPRVAFFRQDFAQESLGALMNALGVQPFAVLLPESLAQEQGLQVGDRIKLQAIVGLDQEPFAGSMAVAGFYRYFPTLYPTERPTLITNLDTLFGVPEAVTGYEVWLNLQEQARADEILEQIGKPAMKDIVGVEVLGNALEAVEKAMQRPEWVGLFGILNVGFLLTILLPGIGFLLYSFALLSNRLIQFGILQALGLSSAQLIGSLTLEQTLLMIASLAGGALVGATTSVLFVPLLQVSVTGMSAPPFEMRVAWGEAGWLCLAFGLVFLASLFGTIVSLSRMQIFTAVKMGEAG